MSIIKNEQEEKYIQSIVDNIDKNFDTNQKIKYFVSYILRQETLFDKKNYCLRKKCTLSFDMERATKPYHKYFCFNCKGCSKKIFVFANTFFASVKSFKEYILTIIIYNKLGYKNLKLLRKHLSISKYMFLIIRKKIKEVYSSEDKFYDRKLFSSIIEHLEKLGCISEYNK